MFKFIVFLATKIVTSDCLVGPKAFVYYQPSKTKWTKKASSEHTQKLLNVHMDTALYDLFHKM